MIPTKPCRLAGLNSLRAIFGTALAALLLLPSGAALALDLEADSAVPTITFDDTDNGDDADWQFVVSEDSASPLTQTFSLRNRVGTNDFPVISITSQEGMDESSFHNAIEVAEDGWVTLAGKMHVGRQAHEGVSIGNTPPNGKADGLWIFGIEPFSNLRIANSHTEYADLEYDQMFDPNGVLNFRIFSGSGLTTVPFKIFRNAPSNSIAIHQSGNIGFGTAEPTQAIDVERIAAPARFQLTAYTDDATEAPQYIQRRARGNKAFPDALQSGDNLGLFSFRGYNGSAMTGSRVAITAQAAGNWSANSNPTRLTFGTTPVGSTVVQTVMEITPQGTVKINGSTLNVPDYVFEDDYVLLPLDELQTFIDANGHLPGIAPADEVNANGLDVAGTQMGLLEKVEELTLYTLQQHEQLKQLDELRAENEELRLQLTELRSEHTEIKALMTRLLAGDEATPVMTAGR